MLSNKQCQCTVCHRVFSTEANFDKHRKGTYVPNTRHCVNPEEIGMKKNSKGIWVEIGRNNGHYHAYSSP